MGQMYSESKAGFGKIPPGQGIYEASSTQKAELGTRLQLGDRVFYYALNGPTALVVGKLVKSMAPHNTYKAVDAAVVAGKYALTVQTAGANTTCTEGTLMVDTGSGYGRAYRIKTAAANATTATYTDITLYDPIETALATSSYVTINYNPFAYLSVCSAVTDLVIGVPVIAVTESYYFWVQTWGPASVASSGAPAAGTLVTVEASTSVTAGVTTLASDTAPIVGRMMQLGVATRYAPVYLTLIP